MLTFIASLKFYSKMWPRANLYAKLANIIGRAALPGTFKNTSLDDYDIYAQQYFFWVFKVLLNQKETIKDFSDGSIYISRYDAQNFINNTLYFLSSQEQAKFDSKAQKELKQIAKPDTKPFEGIDADLLLTMILEEFIETRNKVLKTLKSKYFKQYEVDRGTPN